MFEEEDEEAGGRFGFSSEGITGCVDAMFDVS